MKLCEIKKKLKDYTICRMSFTDAEGAVHRYGANQDIGAIIEDVKRLGHTSRLFFNIWCEDTLIVINILAENEFQMTLHDN